MTKPSEFDALFKLHVAGDLQAAMTGYQELLSRQPNHLDAQVALANVFFQVRRWDESCVHFERALRISPTHLLTLHNYAMCLEKLGRDEEALDYFLRAIKAEPNYESSYRHRLTLLAKLGRKKQWREELKHAVSQFPKSYELCYQLIVCLRDEQQYALGFEVLERALSRKVGSANLNPDQQLAQQKFLGNSLFALGEFAKAINVFDDLLIRDPSLIGVGNNRANALQYLERYDEAMAQYDALLQRQPNDAMVALNKGMLCLLLGRFEEGWRHYAARWRQGSHFPSPYPSISQYPMWDGHTDLRDKCLLLYPEQGYGDTLQFCRFARVLARSCNQLLLIVNPPLLQLIKYSVQQWPDCCNIKVFTDGEAMPPFDFQVSLMNVPHVLHTELATIPNFGDYLFSQDSHVKAWEKRLSTRTKPRVGLAWAGSEKHSNDHKRSLNLESFMQVIMQTLQCDVEWYSLQKELREGEQEQIAQTQLKHYGEHINDFCDTAALVEHMDLIITVDTAVAHLAAGLGKPTWVLLPLVPDFRWLLQREDSPWYPSIKLIRQTKANDWSSVAQRTAQAMNAYFM